MKRFMSSIVLVSMIAPGVALAEQGIVVERSPGYWYSYAEKLPIGRIAFSSISSAAPN